MNHAVGSLKCSY